MSVFERIECAIVRLRDLGLFRDPQWEGWRREVEGFALAAGVPFVDVSSNDYLGLGSAGALQVRLPGEGSGDGVGSVGRAFGAMVEGVVQGGRSGSGGSRLLGGSHAEHRELEACLAGWVGQPAALLFSSGYAANVGVMSALPEKGDVVFSDELNHASIIDGCRLGRATVRTYRHCDLQDLERVMSEEPCGGQRWVVSETYFSMDGDGPDLLALRRLCDRYAAGLVLDEAHALGVFGRNGEGLAVHAGIAADVVVGAFGKSVGVQGGFVAGPDVVRTWLWNAARSFVYSTATSPSVATALMFHVKHVQLDQERRRSLSQVVNRVRNKVSELGLQVPNESFGPIVPIILGETATALAAAEKLRKCGILVYAIRPPTVPTNTARLRVTLTAGHSAAQVDHLLACLSDCCLF